jgi:hypothetical protein
MWSVLGVIIVAALGWKLARNCRLEIERRAARRDALFAGAMGIIDGARLEQQGPHELPRMVGTYKGFPVQVKPVVDTLPTRRLPALWLLVTLQSPLPVTGRFDMMMRPAGPTTFSNFDLLPHTLEHPPGFPEQAVIRTDNADGVFPADVVRPFIGAFFGARAKELLITGNGVRMVWLLAEAERARYGIFRQAEFGDVVIDPAVLRGILDSLLDIHQAVLTWSEQKNV